MNLFERYLTAWVGLCIVIGISLGQLFPQFFQFCFDILIARSRGLDALQPDIAFLRDFGGVVR